MSFESALVFFGGFPPIREIFGREMGGIGSMVYLTYKNGLGPTELVMSLAAGGGVPTVDYFPPKHHYHVQPTNQPAKPLFFVPGNHPSSPFPQVKKVSYLPH